jgi:hypothetical protein
MAFTFSVAEYVEMVYVYGFGDSNAVHNVAEYQRHLLNRRIPSLRVLRVCQTF